MWLPHKTVATVVVKDGRFLMVEELSEDRIVFNQPAGHLEPGETLINAAERETLEETGWEVRVTAFLGLYHYLSAPSETTYIRSCFIAETVRHFPDRQLDQGILRASWLTADEIRRQADRLRSPAVLASVDDFLAGIRYPLQVLRQLARQEITP